MAQAGVPVPHLSPGKLLAFWLTLKAKISCYRETRRKISFASSASFAVNGFA